MKDHIINKLLQKLKKKLTKKVRQKDLYQKRVQDTVKAVMEVTDWDEETAEEKFLDANKRTGCTPKEYLRYRFYERTEEEQDTFYLSCYQNLLQDKYDLNKKFVKILGDKAKTNVYFSEYVRRPWCVNTKVSLDEFKEIFKDTKRIIYKPNNGHCGYGVKSFRLRNSNMEDVYNKLSAYPIGVVEEFIIQHPEMSRLSPSSVNSLRFVTISSNKKPVGKEGNNLEIVYSVVRMGRGNSIVDNLHSGGMVASVDMKTGMLVTDGADFEGNLFTVHPETGTVIKGFKVPYFEETLALVREAIEKKQVEGYLGWDFAISESGPKLLEVNNRPGAGSLQTPYAQEGKGMKHVMEKYL